MPWVTVLVDIATPDSRREGGDFVDAARDDSFGVQANVFVGCLTFVTIYGSIE